MDVLSLVIEQPLRYSMKNFEYENTRFMKKPLLYGDKTNRRIHLSLEDEHITLVLKDLVEYPILLESLNKMLPDYRLIASTMSDMAIQIDGASITCELKQGAIWSKSKHGKFKEDHWRDMSFDEWCSTEQVAREFYGGNRKPKYENTLIDIKDLLK